MRVPEERSLPSTKTAEEEAGAAEVEERKDVELGVRPFLIERFFHSSYQNKRFLNSRIGNLVTNC